jgi:hypothetical protein
MLKCFKFDKLPDGVIDYIKTEQYYTKASLRLYVGMDFGDKVEDLEVGPSYVIAEVSDDYIGEYNLSQLLEKSFKIRAYSYTSLASLQDTISEKANKLLENEKFRESELGKELADTINKVESGVRLIAPIAVTFKMSELPTDFQGNLHKFKDKDYMCKVMSDDYIGFERTPDSIEPGVYYVCLVLLQDYQGKLDYDYFVKSLQHEKLTAYYLEVEKGKELTFRYKNQHYGN